MQRDVVNDRPSARMDAGMDEQVSSMDATTDIPSSFDSGVSIDVQPAGCCRAFNLANQSTCDQLNAGGRVQCNTFMDGTVCGWGGSAMCEDAGIIPDVPNPICCRAVNEANQPLCDTLTMLGRARCTMANGGGTCTWSPDPFCSQVMDAGIDVPSPMDSGVRADTGVAPCCVAVNPLNQAQCTNVAPNGQARCNALLGGICRWSPAAHCNADAGVFDSGFFDVPTPGCCLSTSIANRAICAGGSTVANCVRLAATCVWRTGAACTAEAGVPGSCCVAGVGGVERNCNPAATALQCAAIARCSWRCP